MANPEYVAILKQNTPAWHGWNEWRESHPKINPDLYKAELYEADLVGANLKDADLKEANLVGANLFGASLNGANLSGANLNRATLISADLTDADLSNADLTFSSLIETNFSGANFEGANLSSANFNKVNLSTANLNEAKIGQTTFGAINLRSVKGLEMVTHYGPSTIGIDTIILSQGKISEIFLRKAGVPNSIIESIPSLVGSLQPIDYYSCFISYSSKDQDFADRLYADLQSKGVRCWFAPHDMRIGDKIRPRIDESIRLYDKLLLVLSESSVTSQWVEHEVETAIGKELEGKPNVLFPIRLDEAVMESKTGWSSHTRLTRHIGDFTNWKDHDNYQQAFSRLLRDLKAEA